MWGGYGRLLLIELGFEFSKVQAGDVDVRWRGLLGERVLLLLLLLLLEERARELLMDRLGVC